MLPRQRIARRGLAGILIVLAGMAVGSTVRADQLYARAGWVADIGLGAHDVQAKVTVITDRVLQVENFTYDGTAPAVYFYLGASDTDQDFANGLQLAPLLDRPYDDEEFLLSLPPGETLDGYGAISVWCAAFDVNFSSASFLAPGIPYSRAGWVADIPTGLHDVEGQATIITDRLILVEEFTYDGTAPAVYFYLGANDDHTSFLNGLEVPPLLDRAYAGESLVLLLSDGTNLDGYGAISVWCVAFSVNFSSASFVEVEQTPVPAVSEWGLVVLTLLMCTCGTLAVRRHA